MQRPVQDSYKISFFNSFIRVHLSITSYRLIVRASLKELLSVVVSMTGLKGASSQIICFKKVENEFSLWCI